MKGIELQIARKLLGLSVLEAADHIGKVSKRSWEYWENEERIIKPDVAVFMQSLIKKRQEILKFATEKSEDIKKTAVIYYRTPEYCQGIVDWRFSQSLATTLAVDYGVKLVEFDFEDYENYRQKEGLEDNQQTRSMWAAFKANQ